MNDPTLLDKVDPDEVFGLLADETRVSILQALWEADGTRATFSELRRAVGMPDSGQFNYHLDKLVGRFLTKTDDGYALTQAGKQINGAIEAGAYTMDASIDPIPLERACVNCGGTRTLHYEEESVAVRCDSCPIRYDFVVPAGVFVGANRSAIPDLASRYLRTSFYQISQGFCSFCMGRVEPSVKPTADVIGPDSDLPEGIGKEFGKIPVAQFDCLQCGATITTGLDFVFLDHPAVAGFYHDHGINLQERSIWELTSLHPDQTQIRSADPFRAEITFTIGTNSRSIVVDQRLDVIDIE